MNLNISLLYSFDYNILYERINKVLSLLEKNMIMKYQKCNAPVSVIYLEKYLKRIQKYF